MRCHYLSDLHLESQSFDIALPKGDVLTVAGDLCHARCLDPTRTDRYSVKQRGRAMRLIDEALRKFTHVLLIVGNHEHYDRVFDNTANLLRQHLPCVTVLDEEVVEIEGVRFFGSTLWTDLGGRPLAKDQGLPSIPSSRARSDCAFVIWREAAFCLLTESP